MAENIVSCCKLLNTIEIRTYERHVLFVEQVNFLGIEACFWIRKYKVFVLFHREEELPSFITVVVFINNGITHNCSGCCFIERNDMFLKVSCCISEYRNMMIVSSVDIIIGNGIAIRIFNAIASYISFYSDGFSIGNASDFHSLDGNSLFLI